MAKKKKNEDDDIVDLTEEPEDSENGAESSGKGKRKKKKEKETELPQPLDANGGKPGKNGKAFSLMGKIIKKKGDEPNENGEDGKKKGLIIKLAIIIVPILLVAGFVTEELLFNYLGTRDIARDLLVTAVAKLDPEYTSIDDGLRSISDRREVRLNQREAGLNERETGIAKREEELNGLAAELETREQAFGERESELETQVQEREELLDRRTEQLDKREEQLKQAREQEDALPSYQKQMTEQELADLMSVSSTYSNMAPEVAAAILAELRDPQDIAAILYYMRERNAASILAAMDPEFAARLTEILMNS